MESVFGLRSVSFSIEHKMSELEAKPKATEPEPPKDKNEADKGKDEDAPEPLVRCPFLYTCF